MMAHSFLVHALQQAADTARADGDPMEFLTDLAPIHVSWHRTTFAARRLGFLSFHWHVIEAFKRARGPSMWPGGVRAFALADFRRFGWPYNVNAPVSGGDVDSLAACSLAIESWHNDAHMAVGMAIGAEAQMMDPARNISLREFWRLHYFINARFEAALRRYDGQGSIARKLEKLERDHHAMLGRI
jgi:hypothetical protein